MTTGYVNNTLTFYYYSHKYQFGEAGGTDVLKLDEEQTRPKVEEYKAAHLNTKV